METTKQQEELLGQVSDTVSRSKELSDACVELLNSFGVPRLSLWSQMLVGTFEDRCRRYQNSPVMLFLLQSGQLDDDTKDPCKYNEEDEALFGKLHPDFWIDLEFYDQFGNSSGFAVAVEVDNEAEYQEDTFKVVLYNCEDHEVDTVPLIEVDRLNKLNVYEAVVRSIRFNLDNNIPIDKWGIAHYHNVDPYTYEYLG